MNYGRQQVEKLLRGLRAVCPCQKIQNAKKPHRDLKWLFSNQRQRAQGSLPSSEACPSSKGLGAQGSKTKTEVWLPLIETARASKIVKDRLNQIRRFRLHF